MDDQPNNNPRSGSGGGYNPYNNNPYNNNPYNNPYGAPQPSAPVITKGDGMAAVSMILGFITLVSLLLLRLTVPFFLSGVGIILAVLSKGGARKMIGKAKVGMICCITGLALDVVLCVSAVLLVFALPSFSPELTEEMNSIFEEQYGISYDEMMDEFYDMWDLD